MSTVVSKNIFWLSLSRVFALVLLFFAYARLLRYLGPELYGQYQFVLSFVLLFSTVVDFGIQQFITKKISEEPQLVKKHFHSFLVFESIAAGILFCCLLFFAYVGDYSPYVVRVICVVGLGMVANALTYPFLSVITAWQDLRKVAIINFLNSLINAGFIFSAIIFHQSILFLAFIQVSFGVLDLILYYIFIKKYIQKPDVIQAFLHVVKSKNFIESVSVFKNILHSAWPFVVLVGFSAVYNRIDMVIVSHMLGFTEAGYYGAAYKIFDLLGFFPAVVSHTLFPYFTQLMVERRFFDVREGVEKYLRLMIFASLPMAVGGTILSKQIILLLAGPQYAVAAPVLAILIWAPTILFIYIPVNSLVISQLTKKAAFITGCNVIINIIGNILLIPHFGILAAAGMTVFSECIQGIFYFYFVKKHITDFSFLSLVWQPALASFVMGFCLWFIKNNSLPITLPIGFTVYVLTLFVLNFFRKTDYEFMHGLVFGK